MEEAPPPVVSVSPFHAMVAKVQLLSVMRRLLFRSVM